jgi:hypothetical protein
MFCNTTSSVRPSGTVASPLVMASWAPASVAETEVQPDEGRQPERQGQGDRGDDQGQHDILGPVRQERAEEGRSRLNAHRKDEQCKAKGAGALRRGEAQVPEQQAHQEHAHHGPAFDAGDLHIAEQIADTDDGEQQQHCVLPQQGHQVDGHAASAGLPWKMRFARRIDEKQWVKR